MGWAALAAACVAVSAVDAATVKSISGRVLLNRGDGYKLVAGEALAEAGTTVMASPGARGQIIYPNGCVIYVNPPYVVTVEARSPCTAVAIGQAGSLPGPTGTKATPGTASAPGIDAGTFALGAAVVGGGVGAAILLSQKDRSASD
jgi:hypothetical protein